jgi:type I restriction enzyme S subunit
MHFINAPQFRVTISGEQRGSTRKRISKKSLCALKLPVPPPEEQTRIADEVDAYLSRLDAAAEDLETAAAKLRAYRAAVLKAAVEGRLVPTEAALARAENRAYEPGDSLLDRILMERRSRWERRELVRLAATGKKTKDEKWKARYRHPVTPTTNNLVDLPEGWAWASPEQLSSTDRYSLGIGPFGSNLKVSDYTTRGIPLVFVRNIRAESFVDDVRTRYVSPAKALTLQPHHVAPGDILVTKMGDPPGDCCLYPLSRPVGILTADCIKLRLHTYLECAGFFVHAIRSQLVQAQIQAMTKGVAQKKVSLSRFSRLALPLPPLREQQRIADEVDRLLSVAEQASRSVDEGLQRCNRLRQAILKWAFEGKLVPQKPNDESALKLLSRIDVERGIEQAQNIGRRTKGAA